MKTEQFPVPDNLQEVVTIINLEQEMLRVLVLIRFMERPERLYVVVASALFAISHQGGHLIHWSREC